ncbi:MAG: hypothetical protein NTZ68_01145 [Candidatus Dependentiae bacterium]|nr:hypothetical protein [Candidatus Dependentiae bacterium]
MTKSSKLLIIFASAFVGSQTMASLPSVWDVINVIEVAQGKNPAAVTPAEALQTAAAAATSLQGSSFSDLQKQISLNSASGSIVIPANSTAPGFMNINFESSAGFSFFGDAWKVGTIASSSPGQLAADLKISPLQWTNGVIFVMLAFDQNGKVMLNFPLGTKPLIFYMLLYENNSKNPIGSPVPIMPNSASALKGFSGVWVPLSNSLEVGGTTSVLSATYPAAFTVTQFIASQAVVTPAAAPVGAAQTASAAPQTAPIGTILSTGVSYSSYSLFKSAFTNAKVNFTEVTGTQSAHPFSTFNINFGSTAGYSFFGDAWGQGTQGGGVGLQVGPNEGQQAAADLWVNPLQNSSSNFYTGITYVMIALDASNNVITDLTKAAPATFLMLMYDTVSGSSLGQALIPLNAASKSMPTIPTTVWPTGSNAIAIGGVANLSTTSITYPMAITIKFQPS